MLKVKNKIAKTKNATTRELFFIGKECTTNRASERERKINERK